MRSIRGLLAFVVVGMLVPSAAAARVPQGFVGMTIGGPALARGTNVGAQFDKMVASGVETVRIVVDWSRAQPYADWGDVPVGQASRFEGGAVPTDFSATDRIVGLAARRRLSLLPVVIYTPSWDALAAAIGTLPQPARDAPYADFLALLVTRYGPHGAFWRLHPSLPRDPIRMWQIWNEPDSSFYWTDQPFENSYGQLLTAAHAAIKQLDPGAKVVLAGLSNYSWQSLEQIYKVPGARSAFDVVAVHPYTKQPQGIITILSLVRQVMNRYDDRRKPLIATELGWPSSVGKSRQNPDFATTEAGQASKLGQLFPLLLSNRRKLGLAGFDYYTWAWWEQGTWFFNYAGLFKVISGRFFVKPAYYVFRRDALRSESCRAKGRLATVCAKRA